MRDARRILEFWFAEAHRGLWFKPTAAFDAELVRRFEAQHEAAAAGRLADWQNAPEGSLALLLLLDQFPRNMYRGTARMYATDPQARAIADWAVDRDFDLKFASDDERVFFYLPFEHSEDADDQARCVELCRTRLTKEEYLRYAVLHQKVIAQFGRFPHRNAVLGRPGTPAEDAFLKLPGSSF